MPTSSDVLSFAVLCRMVSVGSANTSTAELFVEGTKQEALPASIDNAIASSLWWVGWALLLAGILQLAVYLDNPILPKYLSLPAVLVLPVVQFSKHAKVCFQAAYRHHRYSGVRYLLTVVVALACLLFSVFSCRVSISLLCAFIACIFARAV